MILVLLGTQNNSFERLSKEIIKLVEEDIIKEKVVIQSGYTKIENKNKNIEVIDFVSNEKIQTLIKEAEYVITHGGVGSIISSLKEDKKVIAIARLRKYNEHVNNHQVEIVELFNKKGYIMGITEIDDLKEKYIKLKNFKPKKYISDNTKIISIIEEFIG